MSETIGRTDTPDMSKLRGATERFKLKLSGGGLKTPMWLNLNTGDAMVYQWYIVARPESTATRVFSWYTHSDGKTYLFDQDGNWLSYEALYGVLKMTLWASAVGWTLPPNRLTVNDGSSYQGNVLTFEPNQKWPWTTTTDYLSAAPQGPNAVTVEWEYVT